MNEQLSIAKLIRARAADLHIKPAEIVRRAGYGSISGGLRRLTDLCHGDLSPKTKFLLDALPLAIDVPAADVQDAVQATMDQIAEVQRAREEAEERAYRRSFVPHLIIVPKRDRPSPLFVVALIGAEKILRRDFDLTQGPDTFLQQARTLVPTSVVAFGEVAGFVINFTADHAIRYGLQGDVLETLPKAVRPGEATLTLKNGRSLVGLIHVATEPAPESQPG